MIWSEHLSKHKIICGAFLVNQFKHKQHQSNLRSERINPFLLHKCYFSEAFAPRNEFSILASGVPKFVFKRQINMNNKSELYRHRLAQQREAIIVSTSNQIRFHLPSFSVQLVDKAAHSPIIPLMKA